MSKMDKRYLSPKECAEYTGISPKTLYRWAKERIVPSIKIGGLVRFDKLEIDKIMSKFKRQPVNEDLLEAV